MKWIYSDGGRSRYFKAENVGDCVTRAIALASDTDYKVVYEKLKELADNEKITKRNPKKSSVRDGVSKKTTHEYIENILGWKWKPTMKIGQGCKVHMNPNELPKGTIIVQLSKHVACIKDGVLYDTYDSSRNETRCVYGYWSKD